MKQLLGSIVTLLEAKEDLVVTTVVNKKGSAPRTSGAKMVVRRDGRILGTIGGGLIEATAIKDALELFAAPGAKVIHYNLTPNERDSLGMSCGGKVDVFMDFWSGENPLILQLVRTLYQEMEAGRKATLLTQFLPADQPVKPQGYALLLGNGATLGDLALAPEESQKLLHPHSATPYLVQGNETAYVVEPFPRTKTLCLFGAGHVSQSVAQVASLVGFRTVVVDDRPEFANRERFPCANEVQAIPTLFDAFSRLTVDEDTYVAIITRGHAHDKAVLAQALQTPAGYIGMIGSRHKVNIVFQELLQEGFTQSDLDRVYSPIGLPIGAETPEEIAVSIVAELIAVQAKATVR